MNTSSTGRVRAFSTLEVAFLIGIPLLWGILLLFHPGGEGTVVTYPELQDKVTAWMVVHLGMMLFIPLMAAVIYLLLRGVEGPAAAVSRIALVPFVVFYSTWEALQGIGVGILVNEVNGLPQAERRRARIWSPSSPNTSSSATSVSSATSEASPSSLQRSRPASPSGSEPRRLYWPPALLGLSGFLITAHPPPYGPTGLALFIVAVLLFVRHQSQRGTRAGRAGHAPRPSHLGRKSWLERMTPAGS